MLRLRQEKAKQLTFLDGFLPTELQKLPKDLSALDAYLDDDGFFEPFLEGYHQRLGRPSIPAETYLRITALKHQYDLSDRLVCALVDDRISWRKFCRIPWTEKVPHPSSLTKIRQRLDASGGDHMAALNDYLVRKASEERLVKARKVRVDTTAVEANIHYPTDANLIQDGVRTVTRLVKQVHKLGISTGQHFRDRTRSLKKRILSITKVLRRRTGEAFAEVRKITGEMADIGEKALMATKAVLRELDTSGDATVRRLADQLKTAYERTAKVIGQARQVNAGQRQLPERLVSIFDADARPIRRGKFHKDTEFGYKVCLTESEERLITDYGVFEGNPPDTQLLVSAVTGHSDRVGKVPKRAATDRGFWAKKNEDALTELGVDKVSIPFRGKCSGKRREHEGQSWFRRLQRWRAGGEATISVLKRRYGMDRTLYRGLDGARRWVGGAIWAYNLNRIAKIA